MNKDCIFCKIVSGKIPCAQIYENNDVLAFLDIRPVQKGHVLVIPKEHFEMLYDTPDEILQTLIPVVKKIMKAIKKSLEADFVALSVVGIDVPHFHVHLIPRYFDDSLANFWPQGKYEEWEIEKFADRIKKIL